MKSNEIEADVFECLENAAKKEAKRSGWKCRLPPTSTDPRGEAVEEVIAGWDETRMREIVERRGWMWDGTTARAAAVFRWRTAKARIAIRELTQGAALVEFHGELDERGSPENLTFEELEERAEARVSDVLADEIHKSACAVALQEIKSMKERQNGSKGRPKRKKSGGKTPYPPEMLSEAHTKMQVAKWGEKKRIAADVLDKYHKAGQWHADSNAPNAIRNFMREIQKRYPTK